MTLVIKLMIKLLLGLVAMIGLFGFAGVLGVGLLVRKTLKQLGLLKTPRLEGEFSPRVSDPANRHKTELLARCPECDTYMSANSLTTHRATHH
jgi:hypothetical protein